MKSSVAPQMRIGDQKGRIRRRYFCVVGYHLVPDTERNVVLWATEWFSSPPGQTANTVGLEVKVALELMAGFQVFSSSFRLDGAASSSSSLASFGPNSLSSAFSNHVP